ncbi:MAG: hypothetical protein IPH13_14480 [Planctomycetes bacterium]|nr:hypothetical protein [Planctomycetota bacterium]MCC7171856.1 hypothetical protein [Planctomycetota bacterium]
MTTSDRERPGRAWPALVVSALVTLASFAARDADATSIDLVVVDANCDAQFVSAAHLLAAADSAVVATVDLHDRDALAVTLREHEPHDVVFMVEPRRLDLDLTHRVIELSTLVDSDPFPDFAHGFVTGLDGAAARRFVQSMLAARDAQRGRRLGVLGVSEGATPAPRPLGAELARACGFSFAFEGLPGVDASARRRRDALERLSRSDLLMLFSHGEPDRMVGAFRGEELRSWSIDLDGRVVVNCACFNGSMCTATLPGVGGLERRETAPESTVALALLDTGVSAYVAGMDAWHGPLAVQVTLELSDTGATLGAAARLPIDRLVMTQLDRPLRFPAQDAADARFSAEPGAYARGNAAGGVLFGDPSFAPFSDAAPRSFRATLDSDSAKPTVRIELEPLVDAIGGYESLLLLPRILAYFEPLPSPPTSLPLELYRVVDWPADAPRRNAWRVASATTGDTEVDCGEVLTAYEETPRGPRLHVVVPLANQTGIAAFQLRDRLARFGAAIVLEPDG